MKNNKILNRGPFLFIIMGLIALMAVGTVSAVGTASVSFFSLDTPTDSATLSTATQSLEIGASDDWGENVTACSVLASSTYGTTSTTILTTFTNGTATNLANFTAGTPFGNVTFDASALEDDTTYTLVLNCTDGGIEYNGTATSTSVIIDYTTPKIPILYGPIGTNYSIDSVYGNKSSLNFSTQIFSNQSTSAGGCKLHFIGNNPGVASYTMNYNEPLCYYDFTSNSKQISEGTYYWYVSSSDGTTTGNSAVSSLVINTPGAAINVDAIPSIKTGGENNFLYLMGALVVIIFGSKLLKN